MHTIPWGTQRLCRRTFLLGSAAIASGTGFLSCDTAPPPDPIGQPTRRLVLALLTGIQNDAFYLTMQKGAQAKAHELGVSLVAAAPAQFDPALQIPLVEAMTAKRVDAILIAACDKDALIEPLKRAHDTGIKIISVDTSIGDGDYAHGPVTFPLSYIGSDNVEGGRIAGFALIKAIGGKGKIYIQNVRPGISTAMQREQGCRSAIEAIGEAVSLVGVGYNHDRAATAREQTATVLRGVSDLAAIFGTNLFSAEGAAHAVEDANLQGIIKVACIDAPEEAIIDLRHGVIDIVLAQQPAQMGSMAVESAVKALSGQTRNLKKRVTTGYVVIDSGNVNTPEAQAAIYTSR